MVEKQEQEALKLDDESPLPSFIQVLCKSSGKLRRFAPGTDAAFALNLINKKLILDHHVPDDNKSNTTPLLAASHIEAVKLGHDCQEEPISFGPTATLLNYGAPWILQTVVAQSHTTGPAKGDNVLKPRRQASAVKGSEGYRSAKKTSQPLGLLHIGKILLALLLIFMIGTIFTLALENLPTLLLYINTNM